ncbi:MAG: phosphotyrosine protein phosphatase [Brevundimonas sp.]|nr:phosphotyrosine protein phosphatase [Brevundimonas sp.]
MPNTNLLFLCARNRLRSPTAERVFASRPGVETPSAGQAPDAEEPVTPDHLDHAARIFVMERAPRGKLPRRFGKHLKGKRVICLDIPDDYDFMQPELVALLEKKVARFLPHSR